MSVTRVEKNKHQQEQEVPLHGGWMDTDPSQETGHWDRQSVLPKPTREILEARRSQKIDFEQSTEARA